MRRTLRQHIAALGDGVYLLAQGREFLTHSVNTVHRRAHNVVKLTERVLKKGDAHLDIVDAGLERQHSPSIVRTSRDMRPSISDGGPVLTWLAIHDLAIVSHLEMNLGPGLWIITGETGAGKSILVTALQLLAGARASSELVRTGADAASIEASFDLRSRPERAQALRETYGFDGDELLIRRIVRSDGRGRAWLNGIPVPIQQLASCTADLIDICSQHEHHSLADPASHLGYLDSFARLKAERATMSEAWSAWREAADALRVLHERSSLQGEREAVLRFQLDEIDALAPLEGEDDALRDEAARLGHAVRLADAARTSLDALHAGDDNAINHLIDATTALRPVHGIDPNLDALALRIDALTNDLEDIARELGRLARAITDDPERLNEVEARLAALKRVARRHGGSVSTLLTRQAELRTELEQIATLDDRLDRLEHARNQALNRASDAARALSTARRRAATTLGTAITAELASLGMGNATVHVDVAQRDANADLPSVDGARLGPSGMDHVELLIAPNRGETPRPLHRIASGGELSRALLAIKRVLADGSGSVQVFDEVDTGVGGAVAEAIGRKLAELARHQQVLCITHQPQIAVYATEHLHVSKRAEGDRTTSAIVHLSPDERTEEIARMLGGIEVDAAHRDAARALERAAQNAKSAQ